MSKAPKKTAKEREPKRRRHVLRGLSAKLLILTVSFVMISEVLIFVPSIANFRNNWLHERLAAAQIASLVIEATPDKSVSKALQEELLANAGAKAIALRRNKARHLMLGGTQVLSIDRHFDLRKRSTLGSIWDAFGTLVASNGRMIRIIDTPQQGGGDFIEIVMDEQPLRAAMLRFSINILTLSLVISALTAGLVFLSIHWLLVRPMRELTKSMVKFGDNPEDTSQIILPSGRQDEIGTAERELENMQRELSQTLQQKNHLAALGLAVSKISHDLRNMLASAQLLSDRIGTVNDPTVRNVAPKLIASLDRAIAFCADTLKFGRAQEAPPRRDRFLVSQLAQEIVDDLEIQMVGNIVWHNDMEQELEVDADKDHLFRVLGNLSRNAAEAILSSRSTKQGQIRFGAWREGTIVTITITDNGPGLPKRALENLFQAFHGGVKAGGTGLGLAISAELVRAHGGEITLAKVKTGTKFLITIPDRVTDISNIREQA